VRLRDDAPVVRATFDDPNLVSCAGLVPAMVLARQVGLHDAVADRVGLPTDKGANPAGKVATIVAGMLVRTASTTSTSPGTAACARCSPACTHHRRSARSCAPSPTVTCGSCRPPGRDTLVALSGRVPILAGAGALTFVDIDSMLRRVYGKQKQGIGFGHAKVGGYNVWLRGYNPLIATLSTPLAAPVIAATRLRSGNAGSARGAASMIAEAITTARACGATGEIVVRADSAFYAKTVITGCRRKRVRFSITARIDAKIRAACESITDDQWVDIKYPQAAWDEDAGRWISDAQIAETVYTAFAGTRHEVTARLIVRRIRRDDPLSTPDRANCCRPTGITRCSPTRRSCSPRPKRSTVATRSSSRPTPI
jgi:DDE family transposase